ncbi:MAG TPA: SOS response-associated peptidase [Firmicutes bacterium]|jgi:putative SOS response-associated peptidase YedK|nr:SOS response-associated peptidase [Bacillota bacterium]
MCGRIASNISGADQLIAQFLIDQPSLDILPRYNIAPSQPVLNIIQDEIARRTATFMRWGLIPSWAKDAAIGNRMINARGETVAEKPAYRSALRRRRCIIPATGFYEWERKGKVKTPYHFYLRSGELMALAGLWETWISPAGDEVLSFTIITTAANELLRPIHDRMPVLLGREQVEIWLDHSHYDQALLTSLLVPYPPERMAAYQVSTYVNSPANEGPKCIAPVA